MNQAELGGFLGVSGAAVGNWERGGAIAEDNFNALKNILELDLTEVPKEEIETQVGRPSRKSSEYLVRKKRILVHRPGIDVFREPTTPRRIVAVRPGPGISFGDQPSVMVNRRLDDALRECLPDELKKNVRGIAVAGGYQYPLLYVSDKLIADLDSAAAALQGLEVGPDSPLPASGPQVSVSRSWRLAVVKHSMAEIPNAVLPFFALFTPFDDKAFKQPNSYTRRAFENKVLGVELMMFDSIRTLAATIEEIESGRMFIEEAIDEDAI